MNFISDEPDGSKVLLRLERIRKLNAENNSFINKDLYRLLYKRDLYKIAYQRIKSNRGSLTPATGSKTLDGMSNVRIDKLISSLKNESYKPKLCRLKELIKPNGKIRPLGVQGPDEKVLQEAVRIILDTIFDSSFSTHSHGFRPNKGCHTALEYVRKNFDGVRFMVEGDITGCFNNIKHSKLIDILRERIADEKFIRLIYKFLKAGYLCEKIGQTLLPLNGTPQGSIISPILCNIYLDKLDKHMEVLSKKYTKKKSVKERNPAGQTLRGIKKRLLVKLTNKNLTLEEKSALIKESRSVSLQLIKIPETIKHHCFIYYVRYADDWIVGVNGPTSVAKAIKLDIKDFLNAELGLELSEAKTFVSDLRERSALFLGYNISLQKRSKVLKIMHPKSKKFFYKGTTGHKVKLKVPSRQLVGRLGERGFCSSDGFPLSQKKLTSYDDYSILLRFNAVRRGLINYYCLCDNSGALWRIDYILRYSAAKTLAHKHKTSCKKIFGKHGRILRVVKESDDGGTLSTSMPIFKTFKPECKPISARDPFNLYTKRLTNSLLDKDCCICGSDVDVESHHIKSVKKRNSKIIDFNAILSRKQIPVCRYCHKKIHAGKYDGVKLSSLKLVNGKYFRKP